MLVKAVQRQKPPIQVMPSGIFMLVNAGQSLNVPSSLRLSGKWILVSSLHPEKAFSPIFVIPSGITILPVAFGYAISFVPLNNGLSCLQSLNTFSLRYSISPRSTMFLRLEQPQNALT